MVWGGGASGEGWGVLVVKGEGCLWCGVLVVRGANGEGCW